MKNKTTVFFGYITFISLIVCLGITFYMLYTEIILPTFFPEDRYDVFSPEVLMIVIFLMLFPLYSGIHYMIRSTFWTVKPNKFKKIKMENEILKKKIEQRELKIKLDKFENSNNETA